MKVLLLYLYLICMFNASAQQNKNQTIFYLNPGISFAPSVYTESTNGSATFTRQNKAYLSPGFGIESLRMLQNNNFISLNFDLISKSPQRNVFQNIFLNTS